MNKPANPKKSTRTNYERLLIAWAVSPIVLPLLYGALVLVRRFG
ncbi:hypothetical protein [Methylibium petroleiphilum]